MQGNNSAFSNSTGSLIASFNGFSVLNYELQIMENGANFATEIVEFWYYQSDDDLPQGSLFLPWPESDSVALFYMSDGWIPVSNGGGAVVSRDLHLAVIDPAANGGLGRVVERAIPILHDTLQYGQLTATRHANGRDWWLLLKERDSRQVYRLLFAPQGVTVVGQQTVDFPIRKGLGQSVFSPDGQFYVSYNAVSSTLGNYLDIFDFDRCTGLLGNQRQYNYTGGVGGVAISPNSRFLYEGRGDSVFQFDLLAPDIGASRVLLDVYDGFVAPFPVRFYQQQLAPDGRIYMTATNGTKYLHVTDRPDEPGTACGFRQHGIKLFKHNATSLPNFPNYRLDPLDGSACDTLGLDNVPVAWWRWQADTLDPLVVAFHDLSYREPATWWWDFGDGAPGSAERHPAHVFPAEGSYDVCLTVANSYGSDMLCRTLTLGLSSATSAPPAGFAVQVGPNPFTDRLTVRLEAAAPGAVLQLHDALGRLRVQTAVHNGDNEIPAAHFAPGTYTWRIVAGGASGPAGGVVKQ